MTQREYSDIAQRIRDGALIDRPMVAAHHRVIRRHRQLGVPLAVWKDGHVVLLAPDSIEVLEADVKDNSSAG
jgi:hypothetical protein